MIEEVLWVIGIETFMKGWNENSEVEICSRENALDLLDVKFWFSRRLKFGSLNACFYHRITFSRNLLIIYLPTCTVECHHITYIINIPKNLTQFINE